ncbi:MAG: ABC transporter ATP-binding protein [Candidatus Bathyarchaeia archaeon]
MSQLRLEKVAKKFGDTTALNDIDLEVGKGEFVCLLGPSGAGKSTTLRLIAGTETLDGGHIYIKDKRVDDFAPKDRNVAMVFQSYALYPNRSVSENIAFPLKSRGYSKSDIHKRIKEVGEILRISHLMDRLPSQLSGGERQRVAIGRAIVRDPDVYLFDEPLTNLDAKLRVHMRAELKKLHMELKTAILYATPDQAEAMAMADKIAVMATGSILQYDTPDSIYDRPFNKFVAEFVGSPAINLLEGVLMKKDGRSVADVGVFSYDVTSLGVELGDESEKQILFGIRPEHITVSTKPGKDAIEADVYAVETIKPECIIDLTVKGVRVVALGREEPPEGAGSKVWFSFDRKNVRLFDRKAGQLIA